MSPQTWSFSKLDWKEWQSKLVNNFSNNNSKININNVKKEEDITKELTTINSKNIKFKSYKPFRSSECSYNIALKRRTQKQVSICSKQYCSE